eukprot:TRINITY_DN4544_c0_g1_i1.p1 TRINITY_DN4544_c0_g1~~TRINITY_DN4544_c0_g1_i1.p1  ORF type:complete len:330 (-),score=17.58 TRINITY_DN4544_c0_g1_i1:28-1017(-)
MTMKAFIFLICACLSASVAPSPFTVSPSAIASDLNIRTSALPIVEDDLTTKKFVEESIATLKKEILESSNTIAYLQSLTSLSCPTPKFLRVAATGGRTRIDLTQYSATPLVFVTAHNPTGPIFPMVINATSAGFYIWSLDKTYTETGSTTVYDIMLLPFATDSAYCPLMRSGRQAITLPESSYSIVPMNEPPTCLVTATEPTFVANSPQVRSFDFSTKDTIYLWRYPHYSETNFLDFACFTTGFLPPGSLTGTILMPTDTVTVTYDTAFDDVPLVFFMSVADLGGWQIVLTGSTKTGFVSQAQNTGGIDSPDRGMIWVAIPKYHQSFVY